MNINRATLLLLIFLVAGCSSQIGDNVILPNSVSSDSGQITLSDDSYSAGRWGCWGIYDLEIACDASYAMVVPDRTATLRWGYDLNAVKLLENHPCSDCLRTSNLHLLANGDVSIDVTIIHPWPASPPENQYCTGFDVRGIVMFHASQYFPDNDLRVRAGHSYWGDGDDYMYRYSTHEKGDPELMNADGWTPIWNADNHWYGFDLEEGLPIFEYYPGKYASGTELATLNGYKRFYTNEARHMFEAGGSATRTYIIRPPTQGSVIEASYAVYAHWAPPTTVPVTDPAVDFPPEANSLLPYELWLTQDRPLDPDPQNRRENLEYNGPFVHMHIKTWTSSYRKWGATQWDLPYIVAAVGGVFPDPDGLQDEYYFGSADSGPHFDISGYMDLNEYEPDTFPGTWPYLIRLEFRDPNVPGSHTLATEFIIANIEFEENDGEW